MGLTDLTIGALSQQSGVHIVTIRYYERTGLLPGPQRTHGGARLYGSDHVRRLNFLRRGRELGFELEELREMLQLVDRKAFTCAEVHNRAARHTDGIRSKIKDLRRLQRVIEGMASQCSRDGVPDCAIIDALLNAKPTRRRGGYQERQLS